MGQWDQAGEVVGLQRHGVQQGTFIQIAVSVYKVKS